MVEKVALVIGAGDGTGGAIAKRFAREGFVACVVRRSAEKLQPLVQEIEASGGRATASVRGRAYFAAFAGAKHALRALAQSMARELGPKGIHVAHVIIDGAIDGEFIRSTFPQTYALKDHGGILDPAHIADHYWMLHTQARDTWTFELDLRPWMENW